MGCGVPPRLGHRRPWTSAPTTRDGNWVSDSASQEPRELTFVDITRVLGDLLIFPDVRRPGGSPRPRRDPSGFAV